MDKIVKGVGQITIIYLGLYLLDTVAVDTGLDKRIDRFFKIILRSDSKSKEKEVNKVELGFH